MIESLRYSAPPNLPPLMAIRKLLPLLVALLTAAAILAFTFKLDRIERESRSQKNRADALNHLSLVRAHLESALNSRLYLTRGLVAFVTSQPEVKDDEFRSFASELIKQQPGIRSIQLAKNSVISHIYPLRGNEKAHGLKLLEHATSKDATQRAIASHRTVVNGPFELVQGGSAIVSRTPVYLDDQHYWGLASILINLDVLLEAAGLNREHPYLKFALRGKDGFGAGGQVFWGDEKIFTPDSVRLDITLPGGSWQIAATHKEGWETPATSWLRQGGILLALAVGALAGILVRNPAKQREEVERATQALRESEENFRSLVENARDFVIYRQEVDPAAPRGARITRISPSIREVLGIDDPQEEDWSSYVHPDDVALLDAAFQNALAQGKTYDVTVRWRHPDKGWIWIRSVASPVLGADGKPAHFAGLSLDITQQKEAEKMLLDAREYLEGEVRTRTQELEIVNRHLLSEVTIRHHTEQTLREQRDLYEALLKAQSDIGEGLFIIENRRIVYANDALSRITGYSLEELRAIPCFSALVHPDLREAIMARYLRRMAGEQVESRYEVDILLKTGKPCSVEVAIATMPGKDGLAAVVVMHDISLRKRMENELKGRVRFIQTLIDAIPNPIFFKDIDGRYLGCNKAFEGALGLSSNEVIGKTVFDFNPPELADIYQRMDNALLDSEELQIYESKVLFADGLRHDILFYKSVFTDASNNVAGLVGTMLDITSRKAAEDGLLKARDELELRIAERTGELAQANQELNAEIAERRRLETEIIHVSEEEQKRIGEELHDGLGQHLTGIAFLSKALEQKLGALSLPEKIDAAEIVQLINQSVSRTRALARGLFPVELESNGLMAALEQLSLDITKLYGIACTFLCNEPVLVYDNVVAINLYRITQEAAGNAVKHAHAKLIQIELRNAGENTLLSVSDDGIGYAPGERENPDSMGIHIMRYRAKMIGAALEILENTRGGVTITVSVNNSDGK